MVIELKYCYDAQNLDIKYLFLTIACPSAYNMPYPIRLEKGVGDCSKLLELVDKLGGSL